MAWLAILVLNCLWKRKPSEKSANMKHMFLDFIPMEYILPLDYGCLCQIIGKKIFPGVELEAVGASILLKTPIVRDVIMLCGTREVTKKAISHGLQNKVSILIIPGGQKEMRYWSPDKTKYIVVTKNKGFIKIALTQGAPLVPMFSFGENDILHNIQLPKIQELTYRYLGFGYPLFPYGRWYSAMPNPTQVSVCVGEPISVPQVTNPPDTLVDHYHQIYYQRLRELFEKYKVKAGYSNCELIYVD